MGLHVNSPTLLPISYIISLFAKTIDILGASPRLLGDPIFGKGVPQMRFTTIKHIDSIVRLPLLSHLI